MTVVELLQRQTSFERLAWIVFDELEATRRKALASPKAASAAEKADGDD